MLDERFCIASCEHCDQHIEFPAAGVGLTVQCPHCACQTVLFPSRDTATAAPGQITAADLKAAFAGPVARRRISVFYEAGLLLVAVIMLLLPLAYLALASLAAYGVYWYAVHAQVLFSTFSGGVYVLVIKGILYVAPICAGVVAVFFMFKPILARPPKTAEPAELNPAQHPRLYQFIAHISELLKVSMPKRIYLDCSLNASAGFRRGWLSFLRRDLVLTLGLPLVAGLNTRQFASVVGHELGHCTQGLAMRLSFIIDGIDAWFLRVIYARDTWDEALEEWSDSVEDWKFGIIVACVNLAVWWSRKLLAFLMLTGHAASCFLSRQMEYHADACAMAIGGSAGLESLLIRLREQGVLERIAYEGLQQFWQKARQLPNSIPEFLDRLEQRAPADFHEQARNTLLNETAGLFATHPTSAQRIKNARQRMSAGILDLERPARSLFNDFAHVSELVTGRHYRQTLRLPVTPAMLKPVRQFFPDEQPAAARA